MRIKLMKILIFCCLINSFKSSTTTSNNDSTTTHPTKSVKNDFKDERAISIDKDGFVSMENLIKFEKWMVIEI